MHSSILGLPVAPIKGVYIYRYKNIYDHTTYCFAGFDDRRACGSKTQRPQKPRHASKRRKAGKEPAIKDLKPRNGSFRKLGVP